MKTQVRFSKWAMLILLVVLSIFLIASGCKSNKGHKAPDPLKGCDVAIGGDGLWNCTKINCNKCVMQIKKPTKDWRDIPGGNVNPDDMNEDDSIRCTCRDSLKKSN
jgi:hypothetical protein